MFTGLIECTGRIVAVGSRLRVESDVELGLSRGDSLAVDGSCLTVTEVAGRLVSFDVSPESFRRIVLPVRGKSVNLERPLKTDGRFHGHFVTGHVDTAGTVTRLRKTNRFSEITISYPERYTLLLVEKGSVAVSGISLTVASLSAGDFTVAVIPDTLKATTAGYWKPGYKVNLEFDIVGKYLTKAALAEKKNKSLEEYLGQF